MTKNSVTARSTSHIDRSTEEASLCRGETHPALLHYHIGMVALRLPRSSLRCGDCARDLCLLPVNAPCFLYNLSGLRTRIAIMGALLSIPLLGSAGSMATGLVLSCASGLIGACAGRSATALCKSCNCNSSVASVAAVIL